MSPLPCLSWELRGGCLPGLGGRSFQSLFLYDLRPFPHQATVCAGTSGHSWGGVCVLAGGGSRAGHCTLLTESVSSGQAGVCPLPGNREPSTGGLMPFGVQRYTDARRAGVAVPLHGVGSGGAEARGAGFGHP